MGIFPTILFNLLCLLESTVKKKLDRKKQIKKKKCPADLRVENTMHISVFICFKFVFKKKNESVEMIFQSKHCRNSVHVLSIQSDCVYMKPNKKTTTKCWWNKTKKALIKDLSIVFNSNWKKKV